MPSPKDEGSGLTVITRVALPAYLTPDVVLEALHRYEPLITANPFQIGFERQPVRVEALVDDPFFRDDGSRLQAFTVRDRVPIIPGVGAWATKAIAIPCVFQSFGHGVRCRAVAQGGVTVRSLYEVRLHDQAAPYGPDEIVSPGAGEYELVETAHIECSALIKPFVRRNFAAAHREILQRVVDGLIRARAKIDEALRPAQ